MSARFLTHLIFLASAVLVTYIFSQNPSLSAYTLQLVAIFVIFYFLNKKFTKSFSLSVGIDALVFSCVTLLLVSQTGGLSSPLFFLVYILLFGLTFLLEPLIVCFFSFLLLLLFYNQVKTLNGLLQAIGLLLMTPLALFFGQQYLKLLEEEEKIKILKKETKKLSKEVTKQEEDTLLWLSLSFKENLIKILDSCSNCFINLDRLNPSQKENLQTIRESAKKLLKLGKKLEKEIEG